MDITVPSAVATAARKILLASDVGTGGAQYAEVGALRFRATPAGLGGGWVLERITSFEFQQPLAGLSVVPRDQLVNVPAFIHNSAYVATNPITGRIIGAGDNATTMLATALVHMAFAAPFDAASGDRWNYAFINLTMPAIADYVIQNPRTGSNPGTSFFVVRRHDYEQWINGNLTAIPALHRTDTYPQALKARNEVNKTAQESV